MTHVFSGNDDVQRWYFRLKTRETLGKNMVYLPDFAAFEIFEVDQAMFFSSLVAGRPTQEQQAAQPASDGLSRRQGFFQAEP